MTFKDGEQTGEECPECGKPLVYYMSFTDQFSPTSGHYTTDFPMIVCDHCDYQDEYVEEYEYDYD